MIKKCIRLIFKIFAFFFLFSLQPAEPSVAPPGDLHFEKHWICGKFTNVC